jgi:tetratricopeptide (TPR) repeat protein
MKTISLREGLSFRNVVGSVALSLVIVQIVSATATDTDSWLAEARSLTEKQAERVTNWLALGHALAQKQRDTQAEHWYDEAEAAYQQALKVEPDNAAAMNGMAWVMGGRHRFTESVLWAKKALAVDADNPEAHGIIGDAVLELGDLERAFECYQKMMDLRPDLSAYSRGGYLVWLTGNGKKGRWLMEKAIAMGSPHAENTAWCRSRLAMMLFHEGAYLPAAQVAEAGLNAAPGHLPLLLALGRIKAALKDEKAAVTAYEAALAQGEHLEALAALGDLHAVAGRAAEAEAFYQKVVKLHEANKAGGVHDHTFMARFFADHDRHLDRALALAKEHLNSQNVYDADTLAWALYKKGEFAAAKKCMERALKANTPDAEFFYHGGLIAAATGDRTGARKLLSRALSLNPGFNPLEAAKAAQKLDELALTVAGP